ncbi:hypothetical protein [Legionella fallonii]|uniref:Putative cyanophycin synthase n=1 Tax=Legionella fallonii LLAP-10 TaxID=1212491 RepID=A0A098G1J8_9GAMM|nr:hypothetical protein [Legionella fallonii]CEG55861.1 putative cyanophycin synthase [Legionella fallonii LLAP-10]
MDRNVKLFHQGAMDLHLPCTYIPELGYLRVELGRKHYYFVYSISPMNQGASVYLSKHKYALNKLLQRAGFPVPKATAFNKERWSQKPLDQLVKHLNFPLVAKPMMNTVRGKDVLCNIQDLEMLSTYLSTFFDKYKYVQIEEFHTNLKEYRVLILKNRVIGVLERTAAHLVGDGIHNVEELIEIRNAERIRLSKELTISPLKFDIEHQNCLKEQGLSLQSIIPEGHKIRLGYTVNTGRDGDIFSLGKKIHPTNAKHLCQAAQVIGLNYVGFDVLCENINVPFRPNRWIIIEANYCADTTLHEIPNQGIRAVVTKKILKQLIYRHPLSYFYHLCLRSRLSIYFKSGMMTLLVLSLIISSFIR